MFHHLCVIAFALLLSSSAHAAQWYAAPDGDDGNDCLTVLTACKTAQATVQKMPLGMHGLHLAPGVYDETIDVSHGRQVSISGPISAERSCPDMNAVTVRRFCVQDNATIWVSCLSTGQVECRQWSIADVFDVRFFGMERPLVAKETCRINTERTLFALVKLGPLANSTSIVPRTQPLASAVADSSSSSSVPSAVVPGLT